MTSAAPSFLKEKAPFLTLTGRSVAERREGGEDLYSGRSKQSFCFLPGVHLFCIHRNPKHTDSSRVGREVIGKETLLPKVEALGETQIRMVLADSDGQVRNPDGSIGA